MSIEGKHRNIKNYLNNLLAYPLLLLLLLPLQLLQLCPAQQTSHDEVQFTLALYIEQYTRTSLDQCARNEHGPERITEPSGRPRYIYVNLTYLTANLGKVNNNKQYEVMTKRYY